MKKLATLLVTLLISFSSFAQTGINYKAVIKDALGNVVSNDIINVKFSIIENTGSTVVYAEDHTNVMTDANGIIVLNIGEGTPTTNTFSSITWGSASHSLKTEIDIEQDASFVNMGTTVFKAVPYALSSANAITKIDDLTDGKSDPDGNSLFIGVNAGLNDDGSDNRNTAIGYQSLHSNSSGFANTTSGSQSLFTNTTGSWNTATGIQSLQFNQNGSFNTATGILSLRQNISGSFNTASGGQALLDNTAGNYNTSMGYGSGERVEGSNNTFFGYRAGSGTSGSTRSISGSVFLGYQAGYNETISNRLYIANSSTTAPLIYGDFNLNFVRINGYQSILTSSGNSLRLESTSSNNYVTFRNSTGYIGYSGIYNGNSDMDFGTGGGNISGKVHLVTGASPKLTIDADGDVGIGTENPSSLLEVAHQDTTPSSGNRTNAFSIRNLSNGRSWQFHSHSSGYLELYNDGTHKGSFNPSSGVYATVSDRRLKKNITPLDNGTLQKVLQLNPVSYLMKDQTDTNINLGLISQEVQELFPSITHYSKEQDILSLSYTELIPVLIKALQEQQTIIENQNSKIRTFESSLTELSQRIKSLEASNNQ